jgi:hypothetical protein
MFCLRALLLAAYLGALVYEGQQDVSSMRFLQHRSTSDASNGGVCNDIGDDSG